MPSCQMQYKGYNLPMIKIEDKKTFSHPNLFWLALSTQLRVEAAELKKASSSKGVGLVLEVPVGDASLIKEKAESMEILAFLAREEIRRSALNEISSRALTPTDFDKVLGVSEKLGCLEEHFAKKPAQFMTSYLLPWLSAKGEGIDEFWRGALGKLGE